VRKKVDKMRAWMEKSRSKNDFQKLFLSTIDSNFGDVEERRRRIMMTWKRETIKLRGEGCWAVRKKLVA